MLLQTPEKTHGKEGSNNKNFRGLLMTVTLVIINSIKQENPSVIRKTIQRNSSDRERDLSLYILLLVIH